jgi:AcrR family transcriptional regulator
MKSTYAQITDESTLDPRVIRTRRLLLDAFRELLLERSAIRDVSIHAISQRAGVNRVTFYAHFTDKYELLDFWKRELFRKELAKRRFSADNPSLEQLIDAVLEFMLNYRQNLRTRINRQFEPLFEAAIQNEIQKALVSMPGINEDKAIFISWAIFGSANEWSSKYSPDKKVKIAGRLIAMVKAVTLGDKI